MRGHRRYFVLQVQQPQHSKNLHSLAKQIRKNFASQNHKFPQKPKFFLKKHANAGLGSHQLQQRPVF
jgi:hypothetical protein